MMSFAKFFSLLCSAAALAACEPVPDKHICAVKIDTSWEGKLPTKSNLRKVLEPILLHRNIECAEHFLAANAGTLKVIENVETNDATADEIVFSVIPSIRTIYGHRVTLSIAAERVDAIDIIGVGD